MTDQMIEAVKASIPVGFLAALIRVILHPDKRWGMRVTLFSSSILIAALVGIWVTDLEVSNTLRSTIIGGSSLIGKEILETVFEQVPRVVKALLNKKLNIDEK